jgi:hypothetical protein
MMETETLFETLVYNATVMWLIIQEDFIAVFWLVCGVFLFSIIDSTSPNILINYK